MLLKKEIKTFISSDMLKMIAMATMVIDHIAASLLRTALEGGFFTADKYGDWMKLYRIMRAVGRTAFPIYAFLLTEGFFHTSCRKKYISRIAAFSILSELPFDMAFYGRIIWQKQNVFITLLLGLLMMAGLEWIEKAAWKLWHRGESTYRIVDGISIDKKCFRKENQKEQMAALAKIIGEAAVIYMGGRIADYLHCDYGTRGIFLIAIFYLGKKWMADILPVCAVGYLLFLYEPYCIGGFLFILFYNGTRKLTSRGWNYFFYLIYPVHLSILALVRVVIFGG